MQPEWEPAIDAGRASGTVKSKAAYEDLFNLWKDADSDISILKEAKAEYGKLQ